MVQFIQFSPTKTVVWFVYSKSLKTLWKGISANILFFKIQVYQNISRYYDKDFEITSVYAILLILLQNLKLFLSVKKFFETITQNNFSKSLKLPWNSAPVKSLCLLFTVVVFIFLKATIPMNLYYDEAYLVKLSSWSWSLLNHVSIYTY